MCRRKSRIRGFGCRQPILTSIHCSIYLISGDMANSNYLVIVFLTLVLWIGGWLLLIYGRVKKFGTMAWWCEKEERRVGLAVLAVLGRRVCLYRTFCLVHKLKRVNLLFTRATPGSSLVWNVFKSIRILYKDCRKSLNRFFYKQLELLKCSKESWVWNGRCVF